MATTERLYYSDSHLLEFDGQVVDVSRRDDGAIAIMLDRTAFYPTGGGQPSDTGTIGDARVVECIDLEDEGILHIIQGPTPEIGSIVHGKIDRLRRLDHMQQHTGQHILSAAFVKLFKAATHSFRVLEHECEIDVALDDPNEERIQQAIDCANQAIWENRPIRIRQVTSAEAGALELRKEPARAGELRLIEIEEFDLTPCGGTHANSTGEIGIVVTRSWERAKGLTRIQFMAGLRVLSDYRKANKTAREVAAQFSAGREDAPVLVAKLIADNHKLTRRVRDLDQIACRLEAEDLLKTNGRVNNSLPGPSGKETAETIITAVFDERDGDSLKRLALALVAHPNVVALLGSRDADSARLVFARSADAAGDMNALMRKVCELIDGRGGGKADLAQGGGPRTENLREIIAGAAAALA